MSDQHHHHHHEHAHAHGPVDGELTETQRLLKRLHHWIHHNDDHAANYVEWAAKIEATGTCRGGRAIAHRSGIDSCHQPGIRSCGRCHPRR